MQLMISFFILFDTSCPIHACALTSCSISWHLPNPLLCDHRPFPIGKNHHENNPMEAAMAVAQKAASNGIQENSQNVIQTVANLENPGSTATHGTSIHVLSSSSPRPNSAPTISTDVAQQERTALPWTQPDTHVPPTDISAVATHQSSMICVVGKKRPCDPMSDVINSASSGALPLNAGTFSNPMSTSVTYSPPGLPQYMSPGNFSQHPHARNAAILQATLLSSQQPIMVHRNAYLQLPDVFM